MGRRLVVAPHSYSPRHPDMIMNQRENALYGLLFTLHEDLVAGKVEMKPLHGSTSFETRGPWRTLLNVRVRYDCVNFFFDDECVEIRISQATAKLAEEIRQIWLILDPSNAGAEAAWARVLTHLSEERTGNTGISPRW